MNLREFGEAFKNKVASSDNRFRNLANNTNNANFWANVYDGTNASNTAGSGESVMIDKYWRVLQNNGVAHGGNLRTNAAAAATANNTAIVGIKKDGADNTNHADDWRAPNGDGTGGYNDAEAGEIMATLFLNGWFPENFHISNTANTLKVYRHEIPNSGNVNGNRDLQGTRQIANPDNNKYKNWKTAMDTALNTVPTADDRRNKIEEEDAKDWADKLYIIQNVTTGVGNENGIDPTNPNNVAGGGVAAERWERGQAVAAANNTALKLAWVYSAGWEADDIGFGLGHTGGGNVLNLIVSPRVSPGGAVRGGTFDLAHNNKKYTLWQAAFIAIGGNNSRNIPVGERTRTTRSFLEKYHELRKSATDVGSNNSAITPATGAAGAGPAGGANQADNWCRRVDATNAASLLADGKPGQGAINSYTGQEAAQILAHVFNNNWLANDLSLENNDITVKKAPDGTKISHSRKLSANANAAGNKFTLLLNNAYSKDDKNNAWGSGGDPVITNSLIDRIFGSARMTINGEPEKSYNNRLESLKLLRLARKALGLTSYTSEASSIASELGIAKAGGGDWCL